MSNKLDKTGYLLHLRRTTVLFKINSARCADHARGLKNAAEQLKIPLSYIEVVILSCTDNFLHVVRVELEK